MTYAVGAAAALLGVSVGLWTLFSDTPTRVTTPGPEIVAEAPTPIEAAPLAPSAPEPEAPVEVAEFAPPSPPQESAGNSVREGNEQIVSEPPAEPAEEPETLVVKLLTDDPNVVIYWLVDQDGGQE